MIARLIRAISSLLLSLPLLVALGPRMADRSERRRETGREQNLSSRTPHNATPRLVRLLLPWVLLLVLLVVEFGMSFLAIGRATRPLILIPAVLMVATVGFAFMQVRRGPTIVRLFATAGLLWLTILLGLGSLDPMTRTDYPVQGAAPK